MPSSTNHPQRYDVVVIGAGQAGLAAGYHLARRGVHFVIVDAAAQIGHSWRTRWDSLRLFTPAQYDALPGLPFPAAPNIHPGKDDVADYLTEYAKHFDLPVRLNTAVVRVTRTATGFAVDTTAGLLVCAQVVVATGPFHRPFIPAMSAGASPRTPQLHSTHYRNPDQLPRGGRTLVVGAANSGLQIAHELAAEHKVTVAVGAQPPRLPQRILGRDLFTWLDRLGVMTKPADSRIARRVRSRGDLVIGTTTRALRRRGVELRPRLTGLAGDAATFADGTTARIDAIVWATGYRSDYSWIDVAGALEDGRPRHTAGVSDAPGLYFIGLPWQTSRGSALLGFVGRDAQLLDRRMAADARALTTAGPARTSVVRALQPV